MLRFGDFNFPVKTKMIVISGIEYIPGGQGYFNLIGSTYRNIQLTTQMKEICSGCTGLRYGLLYFAGQCSAILHTAYTDSFARLMYCA